MVAIETKKNVKVDKKNKTTEKRTNRAWARDGRQEKKKNMQDTERLNEKKTLLLPHII